MNIARISKVLFATSTIALISACNFGGAAPDGEPVAVDATGASSLALGTESNNAETDVNLIGIDGDTVTITATGGSLDAELTAAGEVDIAPGSGVVSVNIESPRTLEYAIFLTDHDATVDGVEAPGAILVGSGSVDVDNATETLAVTVGSGDATVRYIDGDIDELAIVVGSGDVELILPADTNAELAVVASGNIDVSGLEFDGFAFSGSAAGTLGAGGGSIAIEVGSGSVTIRGE